MKYVTYTIVATYSLALWISFANILFSGNLSGDLQNISVDINYHSLLYLAIIQQALLIITIPLNYFFTGKIPYPSFVVNLKHQRLHKLILVLLTLHLFFLLNTGVGKVLGGGSHFLSPLFSLTPPMAIFYLYYMLFREKISKLFLINVIIFMLIELLKGWTSFLLIVFFMEFYFFIKKNQSKIKISAILFALLASFFVIIIGAFFYKYAFVTKNEIRNVKVIHGLITQDLTYLEALSLFTQRLTNFDITVGLYSKFQDVIDFSVSQVYLSESRALLRPIVLQGMMDKNFNSLNNYILSLFYPGSKIDSSVDISIFIYYYLLININFIDALLVIAVTCIFFITIISLYRLISNNNNNVNLLTFLLLMQLINTSSVEVVFSQDKILIVVFFIILYFLKIIEFQKRGVNK